MHMHIRTLLLAASVAALPALAMAQTAPPPAATPPAGTMAPNTPDHHRGDHRERRAEIHAKYEQLSAADKAKFDDLSKQVKQLRQQQRQILGMSKS
jgi:Spy/CpxP family protein refolding chaperone